MMISVIMPVYNVEKYVGMAIESVIKQTYTEWELIIVDDGSTDESLSICQKYVKKDQRIHLVTKENGGVSSARNKGLEYAGGQWIYFMDSDDRLAETCFEIAIKYIKENSVDILNWNYACEDATGINYVNVISPHEFIEEQPEKLVKNILFYGYDRKDPDKKRGPLRSPCNKLFKREIIFENEIRFDKEIKIGEDALFCAMCFRKADRVMFVNEYLYYYRRVSDSADRKYREDIEQVFNSLLDKTYQFLLHDFGQLEINTCFAGLAYDCMARALEKKFVNRENPKSRKERIKQIQKFAENPWIKKAFSNEIDQSVFELKQKAIIFCIRKKMYAGMYFLQKIKEKVKR